MILVLGLGLTGWSIVRFLASRGEAICVVDSREAPPYFAQCRARFPHVGVITGGLPISALEGVTQIVVSPGLDLREPLLLEAQARGIPFYGDIELFARHAKAPVIGITGSNGKSTVTTLVGEMGLACGKKTAVGGN